MLKSRALPRAFLQRCDQLFVIEFRHVGSVDCPGRIPLVVADPSNFCTPSRQLEHVQGEAGNASEAIDDHFDGGFLLVVVPGFSNRQGSFEKVHQQGLDVVDVVDINDAQQLVEIVNVRGEPRVWHPVILSLVVGHLTCSARGSAIGLAARRTDFAVEAGFLDVPFSWRLILESGQFVARRTIAMRCVGSCDEMGSKRPTACLLGGSGKPWAQPRRRIPIQNHYNEERPGPRTGTSHRVLHLIADALTGGGKCGPNIRKVSNHRRCVSDRATSMSRSTGRVD